MAKYINADDLIENLNYSITMLAEEMRGEPFADGMRRAYKTVHGAVMKMPTADVREFFTEDEIALINEYKDDVKAVDFKTAILNAVSVALDKVYWQNVFSNKE